MNRDIIAFTKYKFNVYGKKDIRSGRDSAVVGIVGKSKSLDFLKMLIFWSLVRNSVGGSVYLATKKIGKNNPKAQEIEAEIPVVDKLPSTSDEDKSAVAAKMLTTN